MKDRLGTMPVEEHLLFCIESARTYIDSCYTMCLGAASAKERLDVVCRDVINAGRIPGPRYLANGPEITVTGGARSSPSPVSPTARGHAQSRPRTGRAEDGGPCWCPVLSRPIGGASDC